MIRVHVRSKGQGKPYLLYFIDPATKREKSRSAGTKDRMEAERAAGEWEKELRAFHGEDGTGWDYFLRRFGDEHLAMKRPKTQESYRTALRAFHQYAKVRTVSEITAGLISQFKASIIEGGGSIATAASYLTHLRAALNWAAEVELIAKAPRVQVPAVKSDSQMRGRPLTEAEFKKMIAACDKFPYPDEWKRLLELLWLSGLRLGEALALSWDETFPLVDLDAPNYPLIVFSPASHKSGEEDATIIPPDLFAWLKKTPPKKRTGRVVSAPNKLGVTMPVDKASDRISAIGVAAKVAIDSRGNYATAHDLRRSWGTRWAPHVSPHTLQRMMRHKTMATTMGFYVRLRSAAAGAELYGSSQTFPPKIPKRGPNPENAARKQPKKRGKNGDK